MLFRNPHRNIYFFSFIIILILRTNSIFAQIDFNLDTDSSYTIFTISGNIEVLGISDTDSDRDTARIDGSLSSIIVPSSEPFDSLKINTFNVHNIDEVKLILDFGTTGSLSFDIEKGSMNHKLIKTGPFATIMDDSVYEQTENIVIQDCWIDVTGTGALLSFATFFENELNDALNDSISDIIFSGILIQSGSNIFLNINVNLVNITYAAAQGLISVSVSLQISVKIIANAPQIPSEINRGKVLSYKNTVLKPNYPNPFNPNTTIPFLLPDDTHVTIKVYNINGKEINNLLSQDLRAGEHSVFWNGMDKNENPVSSGIYIYELTTTSGNRYSKKMMLLK